MYTREDLMGRLSVMMGGRAAEAMKNQSITNGAQDDLRRATKLARKMVLQWGMSSDLGNIAYQDNGDNVFLGDEISSNREYSEETAVKIDKEIKKILDEATRNAERTLKQNKEEMNDLIDELIERESLTSDQISSLLENGEILPENGSEPDTPESEPEDTDDSGTSREDESVKSQTDEAESKESEDVSVSDDESVTEDESSEDEETNAIRDEILDDDENSDTENGTSEPGDEPKSDDTNF